MKSWVKALLVALVVLTVTGVLGVVGVKYWMDANRERLKEMSAHAAKEGKAFGQQTDAEGCLREGMVRLNGKGGFLGQVANKIFLKSCLAVAKRPPEFCGAVPKSDQVVKAATWCYDECRRRKHADSQFCPGVMQTVLEACWQK
jgi:hypothetical protein